ncbi:MAG: DUF3078 domain-containing protein [Chitinophagales bacterium]|nr:DUF3078 domain-containing protein [Chitinophagales bacterium]
MRKILSILFVLLAVSIQAQELDTQVASKTDDDVKKIKENPEGWKVGGTGSLTFNQVGLKNWAAGGDPSISLLGLVNGYADLKSGKHLWQNRLGLEYGIQKIKGEPVRKNSDRLELFSKYGYEIANKWYASAYAGLRTVLTPTYEYDENAVKTRMISKFASPMIIDAALGFDFVPNESFSLFLSPLASKMIVVANDSIAGLNIHGNYYKNFRWELGAAVILAYKQDIVKNVNLQTVLKLYKDYRKGPAQNIDVDWQTTIGLKVNDFLSAQVFTHLIWDYDVLIPTYNKEGLQTGMDRKLQFRDVIGVGLAYSLDKTFAKKSTQPVEK